MLKEMNLTDGRFAVLIFEEWMQMLVNGEIADCKRYHDDLFEYYGNTVKSDNAPFYLMFCAFVGCMDSCDKLEEVSNA